MHNQIYTVVGCWQDISWILHKTPLKPLSLSAWRSQYLRTWYT